MEFFAAGNDTKALIRLDPRTKLLLFLTGGFVAINSYDIFTLAFYALGLCLIVALCGKPAFAAKAAVAFLLVAYLRSVMNASSLDAGSAILVPLLSGICTLILFGFPIIVSFMLIMKTTRISQFLAAFQRMHLPASIIIPIAVFFRFIPTVQEEWNCITKAMAFRGVSLSPTSVIAHPAIAVERILVPLMFSTMEVMDELSAAALARGLDSARKRSCYEVVKLGWADYIVIAALVSLIVFLLVR